MNEVFVKVGKASSIPEGKSKKVMVWDEEIALWRVGGKIYAVNNVCAHQHVAALHQGILEGLFISCPMHGWTYSLETGKSSVGSGSVKTYAVKLAGDDIMVKMERVESEKE